MKDLDGPRPSVAWDGETIILDDIDEFENIYLELCDEEGEKFTSLTTFHGMIRIFTSKTWTSLIFWTIVVVTCLTLYMIFCGYLLTIYSRVPTFHNVHHVDISTFTSLFKLCSQEPINLLTITTSTNQITYDNYCCFFFDDPNLISVSISNTTKYSGVSVSVNNSEAIQLRTGYSHTIKYEATHIERLNLTRSPCVSNWSDISQDISHDEEFSAARCAALEAEGLHPELTCYPSCSETFLNFELSLSKVKKSRIFVDIHLPEFLEFRQESRKMGINDVLSLLGGGTSLFMGCSCVTLMETFIFLFKLVVQAFSRSNDDATEKQKNEDVEIGVTVENTQLTELLPVPAKTKRLSFVRRISIPMRETGGRKVSFMSKPFVRYIEPHSELDGIASSPAVAPKKPPRRLEFINSPAPIIEEEPSTAYTLPSVSDRIGQRNGLKRQAAVDIPDEDESLLHRLPEVTVDDSSDHFSHAKKFRRYSSVTSKCSSAGSGPHSIRIVRATDTKRRSQIFTRHMLMNDF